jgi:HTH-type transcriptional regulator/antitoxin HigA
MNHAALKNTAQELSTQASFLVEIKDNDEYQQALALMEELIDDYDNQQVLIELLTVSIKRW